jgi:anti-sigma regulatory factor (Ser/Thr protein kinase)
VQPPASQTIEVSHVADVAVARRAAKAAGQGIGLEPHALEELALAVTELATNLLKHARSGRLFFRPLRATGRIGLEVESVDRGPGISNIQQALTDGFSTAGSRGTGLGAVNRLMDEFEIASEPGAGTRILCRKWLRNAPVSLRPCPLAFGVATRPHPGYEINGDAFVIHKWDESALVGVIDGLGHGQFAHRAAEAARRYVEKHYVLPLPQLFSGVARACHATRGVVMALVRFDWGRNTLALASVGDIEVRIFPRTEQFAFPIQRSVLGLNSRSVTVTEHAWAASNVMVLHSDGLRSHWSWDEFPGLLERPPAEIAQQLLRALARDQDDATVLVVHQAKQ